MNKDEFFNQIASEGGTFLAGIVNIDVIDSSKLSGENLQIEATKNELRKLVEDLISELPIALLDWRGDGGVLISQGRNGFDEVVVLCDKIVNLLPFFNNSQGRYNFLRDDRIHLRIVCDSSFIEVGKSPNTLTAQTLNKVIKFERDIGIRDHVVVTERIYEGLAVDIKARLTKAAKPDKNFGDYYVLDSNQGNSIVRKNLGTSQQVRDWISAASRLKKYDEILIFTYTNESLYEYLSAPLPGMRVRVLARNWLSEAAEEEAYNSALHKLPDVQDLRRFWKKSEVIRSAAKTLVNDIHDQPFGLKVDLKFYDQHPFFKGIILRNSSTGRRIGYIGFYSWDWSRLDGGSPILGEDWSAIWLSEDGGAQTNMLDALESRFEELWTSGKTFEEITIEENKQREERSIDEAVRAVWSIDGTPFKIVVPGREQKDRIYPLVGIEDLLAVRNIEERLREFGAEVNLEIMTEEDSSKITKEWDGHLVYVCHRTIDPGYAQQLGEGGFPFEISAQKPKPKIVHLPYNTSYFSPMDEDPPRKLDMCIVAKIQRPDLNSKIFIIAGLHGMGTLAGSEYLTDLQHLSSLFEARKGEAFWTLLETEFEVPWKVLNVKNITHPDGPTKRI
ncbi:MAG: hypothetical protein KF701_09385 [Anaerolineales bacterium]|nr:MAG: hypothetical protein KF701_09385 [Anaerolineales bacterium]